MRWWLWRLTLRLRYGAPSHPENEPGSLKTLSHMAHWSFYGLLAAMSVSGGVAWFANVGTAAEAHNLLKIALLALIMLHILAVPFHRIVLKNNVMLRIVRAG
ncbi:cytochrome b/b6 domain-containing protein [Primorskyibacter sp. 2E107]